MQDTYLVYADAGDQYAGRVVSGLPQYSHDFALLPPFFKDTSDPLIVEALDVCFPSHRGRIEDNVLVFCLASIVYHQHWLREHIGAAHPVFRTPLFLHESLLVQLGAKVKCRLPKAKDAFCSTGIPPHIDHLSKLKVLEAGLAKGFSMVEKKCDDVVGDIMRGLDERQVESHLTPTGLRNQLSALIEELGLNRIRDFLSDATRAGATGASGSGAVESSRQLGSFPLFVWDDGTQNRLLPQDFRFPPNGSVRDSWLLYLVGVPTKGIRPLKDIGRDHFNVPDARKRASEFFQLMELFEAHVKGAAAWENDFSVEAAIRMFEAGKGCLSATSNTANKYSRRADQLGWRRAHSLLVGKSAKVPLTIRKDRVRHKIRAFSNDGVDDDVVQEQEGSNSEGEDSAFAVSGEIGALADDIDDDDEDYVLYISDCAPAKPARKRLLDSRAMLGQEEKQIVDFAYRVYGLHSNPSVASDGSCFFSAAAFQLDLVFPAGAPRERLAVRLAIVEWVVENMANHIAIDVLISAGYDSLDDWARKMRQPTFWADELCLEGLHGAFDVDIRLITNQDSDAAPHESVIGNGDGKRPLIHLGCILDRHYLSLEPDADTPSSNSRPQNKRQRPRRGR